MKKAIFASLIILTFSLITSLSSPKNQPKLTLLSNDITQINAPTTQNLPPQMLSSYLTGAEPADQWRTVQMRVTAYCPCEKCCGDSADWLTASGHKIQPGESFVAADRQYPFGTEMVVAGYNDGKPVKVLDRGGAIRGNRLDVFFSSHQQALDWGVKYLTVKILQN